MPAQLNPSDLPQANVLSLRTVAASPDFRVLIYPFRGGEPLPQTTVTPATGCTSIAMTLPDQADTISLTPSPSGKTDVVVSRNGADLVKMNKPVPPLIDPASDVLTQKVKEMSARLATVRQQGFSPANLPGFVAGWQFDHPTNGAYAPIQNSDPTATSITAPTDSKVVEGLQGHKALGTAKQPAKVTLSFAESMKGGPFSVAFWLKTKVDPNMASLFGLDGRAFNMGIVQGNVHINGGGKGEISTSPTTMLSSWTHFVVTADGTNLSLYRNGFLLWTSPMDPTKTTIGKSANLGGDNGYGDAATAFQNLYLYKSCLSPDQVEDLYVSEKY
jgi:hypothetical protein